MTSIGTFESVEDAERYIKKVKAQVRPLMGERIMQIIQERPGDYVVYDVLLGLPYEMQTLIQRSIQRSSDTEIIAHLVAKYRE